MHSRASTTAPGKNKAPEALATMSLNVEQQTANRFPFLQPPAELREMVYRLIAITTQQYVLPLLLPDKFLPTKEPASITLVTKSAPAALLAVCCQIRHEALPFFEPLLAVLQEPNRFIVDNDAVHIFSHLLGFVDKSLNEKAYLTGLSPGLWQFVMKTNISVDTAKANAFLAKCIQCLASPTTSSLSQLRFRQTTIALNGTPSQKTTHRHCGRHYNVWDSQSMSSLSTAAWKIKHMTQSRQHVDLCLKPRAEWDQDSSAMTSLHKRLQHKAAFVNRGRSSGMAGGVVNQWGAPVEQDIVAAEEWEEIWEEGEKYA